MEKQDTTDKVLGHFKTTGIGKAAENSLIKSTHAHVKKKTYINAWKVN